MPKPKNQFKRPAIDLGGDWTTPKTWAQHPVKFLSVGDIVADAGSVEAAQGEVFADGVRVRLTFQSGIEWLGLEDITLFSYSAGRG